MCGPIENKVTLKHRCTSYNIFLLLRAFDNQLWSELSRSPLVKYLFSFYIWERVWISGDSLVGQFASCTEMPETFKCRLCLSDSSEAGVDLFKECSGLIYAAQIKEALNLDVSPLLTHSLTYLIAHLGVTFRWKKYRNGQEKPV